VRLCLDEEGGGVRLRLRGGGGLRSGRRGYAGPARAATPSMRARSRSAYAVSSSVRRGRADRASCALVAAAGTGGGDGGGRDGRVGLALLRAGEGCAVACAAVLFHTVVTCTPSGSCNSAHTGATRAYTPSVRERRALRPCAPYQPYRLAQVRAPPQRDPRCSPRRRRCVRHGRHHLRRRRYCCCCCCRRCFGNLRGQPVRRDAVGAVVAAFCRPSQSAAPVVPAGARVSRRAVG
jgi:hypothetical protein